MNWVDIIVIILLILGLLGGLKEGAVKAFSSLMAMYIAVFISGLSYGLLASLLAFLPYNWSNFLGFFFTAGIISVILHFVFFIPRKYSFVKVFWYKLNYTLSTEISSLT